MSAPDRPLPAATPSREELARLEVGHTAVLPPVARALTLCFLVSLAAVPAVEWAAARSGVDADGAPWTLLAGVPGDVGAQLGSEGPARVWTRVVAANRGVLAALDAFERAIDDQSIIGRTLRRPAQAFMTRLGAGNERVYPGREGWLFYRPDVESLTGEGFLEPARLQRRASGAAEWDEPPQADPRPSIVRFARDLEERGATLVVMPTPVKPGVHPEALAHRYEGQGEMLHNRSYPAFRDDLREAGVLVFDPPDALARTAPADPQYLATDTHWRPEAMEAVAELLAAFIRTHVSLPPAPDPGDRVERMEVSNTGDTARMLDLAERSTRYPAETVWLRRVLRPDGSVWRSTRGADVLLLGDSFANIYSLESMGWGTSAGFAEQLSHTLARPIDRIVQNDEGAFATRAQLQRDPGRLAGVRVVVYQFAARELAFGDWRVLPVEP